MSVSDYIIEADKQYKKGEKYLETGLFKWTSNYLDAERCFKIAADLYVKAKVYNSAIRSWTSAKDCSYKMGNLKQAACTLEIASRSLVYDKTYKHVGSEFLYEAGMLMFEDGEIPIGISYVLRAIGHINNLDKILEYYRNVANIISENDEYVIYTKEFMEKYLSFLISINNINNALEINKNLFNIYNKLKQPHNMTYSIITSIILYLSMSNPKSAQEYLNKSFEIKDYIPEENIDICHILINSYSKMDTVELNKAIDKCTYLDHVVIKLAKNMVLNLSSLM